MSIFIPNKINVGYQNRELTNIEKQLNSLLSDDKQTELQIDSLESLLKS